MEHLNVHVLNRSQVADRDPSDSCGVEAGYCACGLDHEEELRAQRALNRARVPEIARYLIENPKEYVFSSITASMDADVDFTPTDSDFIGKLTIPMSAKFIINDGQHRRAAIEEALKERP